MELQITTRPAREISLEMSKQKRLIQMVKIARPSRIISEFDTLDVYFTGCSVLDGQLTLWGQLNDIDDPGEKNFFSSFGNTA